MGITAVLPVRKGKFGKKAQLLVTCKGGGVRHFSIKGSKIIIGQAGAKDIKTFGTILRKVPIMVEGNRFLVSPYRDRRRGETNIRESSHAVLLWKKNQYVLEDTSGTGTIVNGELIHLGTKPLVNKAKFKIGGLHFEILY